ncbi:MAG: AMP-binding protein, partial [Myxococcota bacterium]
MSQNIGQLLTKRAYRDPGLEALIEPASGRRFTYSELNARSNRVANALTDMGIDDGDRVGLLLMNGVEFIESFFAVAKIGAVNVPLNWRLVADELEFIISDAGAKVLIFSSEFSDVAAELRSRGTTAVEHWIQLGGEADASVVDFDAWMSAGSEKEPVGIG